MNLSSAVIKKLLDFWFRGVGPLPKMLCAVVIKLVA
jgi:hypothetical protein